MSNDNAFSESCFKTTKCQPAYPERFAGVAHGRAWCAKFFDWYANRHRHSGLAFLTPADVFFGRVGELAAIRQTALDLAYAAHPGRFIAGRPKVALPPSRVVINPVEPAAAPSGIAEKIARAVPLMALPGVNSARAGTAPA